jgi:hypothetical protein
MTQTLHGQQCWGRPRGSVRCASGLVQTPLCPRMVQLPGSANGTLSRNGLGGSNRVSECGQISRMLSLIHRLIQCIRLIAWFETGLLVRRPEKVSAGALSSVLSDTFSSPVRERKRAKLRRFRAISRVMQADFSALQTAWRSMQSRANRSPREFPANREKYREFGCSRRRDRHRLLLSNSSSWTCYR